MRFPIGRLSFTALALAGLMAGCAEDVRIVGKYSTFKADQGYAIVDGHVVVVGPTVQQYKLIANRYVVGNRTPPKYAGEWFSPKFGAFVLDTTTGAVRYGLRPDEITNWLAHRSLTSAFEQTSWIRPDD